MSDTQQHVDWWLASDSKWYPPQSRPSPPMPPAPPVPPSASPSTYAPSERSTVQYRAEQPSVSGVLAGWLQALLWLTSAAGFTAAVLLVSARVAHKEFMAAPVGSFAEEDALELYWGLDDAANGVFSLGFLIWFATLIVLMVWSFRAHKATSALVSGTRSWSRGWTIGGWFIPIAHFVIPKLVLGEIERIAAAPRVDGLVRPGWRHTSTSAAGWLWWLSYIAGTLLMGVGAAVRLPLDITLDQFRLGYTLQSAGVALWALSMVFAVFFIRTVSRQLSSNAMR